MAHLSVARLVFNRTIQPNAKVRLWDLGDLVAQVKEASQNIKRADDAFGQRLDGIEASVNELFRKTSRPGGFGGDNASFERKEAIEFCKSRHGIAVSKTEEIEYSPSSSEVDQAISAQRGLTAYLRHGDMNRLAPECRKSLSAFSLGPPGNFFFAADAGQPRAQLPGVPDQPERAR